MKFVPNIITTFRIFLSIALFFTKPLSVTFFIIYTICGISDVLDGFIARKTGCISKTGAILDSIADLFFVFSMMIILLPLFKWRLWMIVWISLIILVRLVSMLIGFIKYHVLVLLHTYSNKLTGFLLFLFAFLYRIFDFNIIVLLLCAVASFSAVEELIINVLSKKLDRNIKSLKKKGD